MQSTLENIRRIHWYNSFGYQCNIDLSRPSQVKGVTNLSDEPIIAVHSSQSFAEEVTDSELQSSALDVASPRFKEQKFKRHIVSDVLKKSFI